MQLGAVSGVRPVLPGNGLQPALLRLRAAMAAALNPDFKLMEIQESFEDLVQDLEYLK